MNTVRKPPTEVIAPPPVLYLTAFLIGSLIQLAYPFRLVPSGVLAGLLAIGLLTASAGFARWAFVTMRRAGASASHQTPSIALSTAGPFRISRNPIYVAMTGLYLGGVFLLNSVWPLVWLPPLLVVMHHGVILREERYLRQQFGAAYLAYQSAVRRWL